MNQNRFLVRRARLRVARDWDYASFLVEVDGNTVRGPTMRLQKAELSLVYGRSKEKGVPPIAQLTMGQFDLPFGFDLVQSPRTRWFMERSTVSRALWPGEPDVGGRFSGGLGFARYALALTNGEPIDEKSGLGLQDPNANKDFTGRFGAEVKSEGLTVSGGVSFNRGKGFHANTDPTKAVLIWNDSNGDGVLQPQTELQGSAPQSAQPAKSFERWAVGADLQVSLKTGLGQSMLYGEVISASNLDRGLVIADPVLIGDVREFGWYVAFTQEISPYAAVGFRYDHYDPNADSTTSRGGKPVPSTVTVRTLSPMVGLALPDRARLIFQYDAINDYYARDSRGVPTDLENNQWFLRLQVQL